LILLAANQQQTKINYGVKNKMTNNYKTSFNKLTLAQLKAKIEHYSNLDCESNAHTKNLTKQNYAEKLFNAKLSELKKSLSKAGKLITVRIEIINDTVYVFSSELACLRMFHDRKFGRVEYSENLKEWFYAFEETKTVGVVEQTEMPLQVLTVDKTPLSAHCTHELKKYAKKFSVDVFENAKHITFLATKYQATDLINELLAHQTLYEFETCWERLTKQS
jgi:hypothetical protein